MILPAMPAFYQMPKTLDDLADFMAGKILVGARASSTSCIRRGRVIDGSRRADLRRASTRRRPAHRRRCSTRSRRGTTCSNHVLSAGLDRALARRARSTRCSSPHGARVLDLCTGTADLALATVRRVPRATVVGVDFAGAMLRLGLDKVPARGLDTPDSPRARRRDADSASPTARAMRRRSPSASATSPDPERRCAELARVLRPGGRLAILEFGQPRIPGIRTLLSLVLSATCCRPSAGSSRSTTAPTRTCRPRSAPFRRRPSSSGIIASHGFRDVRAVPLTFGIVYLYIARN